MTRALQFSGRLQVRALSAIHVNHAAFLGVFVVLTTITIFINTTFLLDCQEFCFLCSAIMASAILYASLAATFGA